MTKKYLISVLMASFLATTALSTPSSSTPTNTTNSKPKSACILNGNKYTNVVSGPKKDIVVLEWDPKDQELAGLDIKQKCEEAASKIQAFYNAGNKDFYFSTDKVADEIPTLCIKDIAIEGRCAVLKSKKDTKNLVEYILQLEAPQGEISNSIGITEIADTIIHDQSKLEKKVVAIKIRGGTYAMTDYSPIPIWKRLGFPFF